MRHLTLILLTLLLAGCYDAAETPADVVVSPPAVTSTLAALRQSYAGAPFEVSSDLVVAGVVTSDDRANNFYRTLQLEADGVGVECMAGIDGLHNIYPKGSKLTICLRGLAIGESHGILQIGRSARLGSGYATDYIGSRAALDRHLFRSVNQTTIQPLILDLNALTPALAGRLVRADGVRFSPKEVELSTWSGSKRFIDETGAEIYTYTRPYANFAQHEIPSSEVLLIGILQYDQTAEGARYTLKLRDETDCWY
ncbi:MAG: DUF5689 domain-containing protein [Alistipes sp.]